MFPAAAITGASLPGVSTGEVLRSMEAFADKELPRSMSYEWTELSLLQKQSSKIEFFGTLVVRGLFGRPSVGVMSMRSSRREGPTHQRPPRVSFVILRRG
jgi:hypothetical protein